MMSSSLCLVCALGWLGLEWQNECLLIESSSLHPQKRFKKLPFAIYGTRYYVPTPH